MNDDPFENLIPLSLLDGHYATRQRRNRGILRFGYREDPNDKTYMIAIPAEMDILLAGLQYLRHGHSYRRVARWITAKSKRNMDHKALERLYKAELQRQRQRRQVASLLPTEVDDAA